MIKLEGTIKISSKDKIFVGMRIIRSRYTNFFMRTLLMMKMNDHIKAKIRSVGLYCPITFTYVYVLMYKYDHVIKRKFINNVISQWKRLKFN